MPRSLKLLDRSPACWLGPAGGCPAAGPAATLAAASVGESLRRVGPLKPEIAP